MVAAKSRVKTLLANRGWDVRRLPTAPAQKRRALMERHNVDLVIDVGANVGQYATRLRQAGYSGRIVSFEPLPDAFADLARAAADDPLWDVRNAALGSCEDEIEFHISEDLV